MKLTLTLEGLSSFQERRTLAQAIFHKIAPLFGVPSTELVAFEMGWISHKDGDWRNEYRDYLEGIRLARAPKTETPEENLGFKIRMLRLNAGLTQGALARRAGVGRAHLSQIERGHCLVRPDTLQKLEGALAEKVSRTTELSVQTEHTEQLTRASVPNKSRDHRTLRTFDKGLASQQIPSLPHAKLE